MSRCTFRTCIGPDEFQSILADARVELLVSRTGPFKAQVGSVIVGHFHLVGVAESGPAVGIFRVSGERTLVAFSTHLAALQRWQGVALRPGELILFGPDARFHHFMQRSAAWACVAVHPDVLDDWCRVLSGEGFRVPSSNAVLRPSRSAHTRFARIHEEAVALANTRPEALTNPELARAVEQELIHALVTCLTAKETRSESCRQARTRSSQAELMLRFDGYAGTLAEQPLSMAEIAEELAIAPRTLRSICGRFLGMSPHAYVVAKRLDAARIALHEADPATQTLASIANAFGFRRPDRFAAIYRVAFGENPSLTARSAPPSRIT